MSALEQKIFEKVRQLEAQQQQQVLDFLEQLPANQPFDHAVWQADVDAIYDDILAHFGKEHTIDVQSLLDDVREDAS